MKVVTPRRRRSAPGVPLALARRPLRTVRPADAVDVYAQPRQQLARLERGGVLHRVANGYYVLVPQEQVGAGWLPSLEAAAAGIAVADVGYADAIVMGVSAARMHGAMPRALATAVVALPRQRAPLQLRDRNARVVFVKRAVNRLRAESMSTELGRALVTTVEQTVLDLAHRPDLGDADEEAHAAVRALLSRSDPAMLREIAREQRLGAALRRVLASAAVDDA